MSYDHDTVLMSSFAVFVDLVVGLFLEALSSFSVFGYISCLLLWQR